MKNHSRYMTALSLRREGKTLREVGEFLGVTRNRAWQMCHEAERMEKKNSEHQSEQKSGNPLPCQFDTLSTRTRNCILAEYSGQQIYPPISLVREWVDTGHILRIPNLGVKSRQEIINWLASFETRSAL